MFKDNGRYISRLYTRDDYINLNLSIHSTNEDWVSAISILCDWIEGRYLNPIESLIDEDVDKNGFAAMALVCLLIEALLQFRKGLPQTPNGFNKKLYSQFLVNHIGGVFDLNTAERFYKEIRCGILHSAQTQNGSCLTFDTDYIVRVFDNDILMVNVQKMFIAVKQYFDTYCLELEKYINEYEKSLKEEYGEDWKIYA